MFLDFFEDELFKLAKPSYPGPVSTALPKRTAHLGVVSTPLKGPVSRPLPGPVSTPLKTQKAKKTPTKTSGYGSISLRQMRQHGRGAGRKPLPPWERGQQSFYQRHPGWKPPSGLDLRSKRDRRPPAIAKK